MTCTYCSLQGCHVWSSSMFGVLSLNSHFHRHCFQVVQDVMRVSSWLSIVGNAWHPCNLQGHLIGLLRITLQFLAQFLAQCFWLSGLHGWWRAMKCNDSVYYYLLKQYIPMILTILSFPIMSELGKTTIHITESVPRLAQKRCFNRSHAPLEFSSFYPRTRNTSSSSSMKSNWNEAALGDQPCCFHMLSNV